VFESVRKRASCQGLVGIGTRAGLWKMAAHILTSEVRGCQLDRDVQERKTANEEKKTSGKKEEEMTVILCYVRSKKVPHTQVIH
jgi:hypothetical protein